MAAERYEIRVKGKLNASLQASFEGMTTHIEPVETVIAGTLRDQAELYGVLSHVQALGLELIEVRRVACDLPSLDSQSTDMNAD